jgi:hypothetical protein
MRKDDRRPVQLMVFPGVHSLIIDTKQFPLTFEPGDVGDLNQQFTDILEDLRLDVKSRGVDLTDYEHNYLERLRDIGRAAYNVALSPAARQRIAELRAQEQQRGLSLTFKTPPTYSLFWEMLYGGEPGEVEMDQFWGFRYPLGRTYWEIEAPDRIRLRTGIFSAIHSGLKSSREEVMRINRYLEATGKALGLPLGLQLLEDAVPTSKLSVEYLLDLFHSDEFDYGIVHFACHAENPKGAGATRAYLSLTAHDNQLEMALHKLLTWQEKGFMHRPFVFLNACSSATPGHMLQTLSFPTEILNFGAGGVVATACTIHDGFASAFASELYRRLLGQGKDSDDSKGQGRSRIPSTSSDIGVALMETRLHFLEKYNNPLGLAYGLYAVSNQQLRLLD